MRPKRTLRGASKRSGKGKAVQIKKKTPKKVCRVEQHSSQVSSSSNEDAIPVTRNIRKKRIENLTAEVQVKPEKTESREKESESELLGRTKGRSKRPLQTVTLRKRDSIGNAKLPCQEDSDTEPSPLSKRRRKHIRENQGAPESTKDALDKVSQASSDGVTTVEEYPIKQKGKSRKTTVCVKSPDTEDSEQETVKPSTRRRGKKREKEGAFESKKGESPQISSAEHLIIQQGSGIAAEATPTKQKGKSLMKISEVLLDIFPSDGTRQNETESRVPALSEEETSQEKPAKLSPSEEEYSPLEGTVGDLQAVAYHGSSFQENSRSEDADLETSYESVPSLPIAGKRKKAQRKLRTSRLKTKPGVLVSRCKTQKVKQKEMDEGNSKQQKTKRPRTRSVGDDMCVDNSAPNAAAASKSLKCTNPERSSQKEKTPKEKEHACKEPKGADCRQSDDEARTSDVSSSESDKCEEQKQLLSDETSNLKLTDCMPEFSLDTCTCTDASSSSDVSNTSLPIADEVTSQNTFNQDCSGSPSSTPLVCSSELSGGHSSEENIKKSVAEEEHDDENKKLSERIQSLNEVDKSVPDISESNRNTLKKGVSDNVQLLPKLSVQPPAEAFPKGQNLPQGAAQQSVHPVSKEVEKVARAISVVPPRRGVRVNIRCHDESVVTVERKPGSPIDLALLGKCLTELENATEIRFECCGYLIEKKSTRNLTGKVDLWSLIGLLSSLNQYRISFTVEQIWFEVKKEVTNDHQEMQECARPIISNGEESKDEELFNFFEGTEGLDDIEMDFPQDNSCIYFHKKRIAQEIEYPTSSFCDRTVPPTQSLTVLPTKEADDGTEKVNSSVSNRAFPPTQPSTVSAQTKAYNDMLEKPQSSSSAASRSINTITHAAKTNPTNESPQISLSESSTRKNGSEEVERDILEPKITPKKPYRKVAKEAEKQQLPKDLSRISRNIGGDINQESSSPTKTFQESGEELMQSPVSVRGGGRSGDKGNNSSHAEVPEIKTSHQKHVYALQGVVRKRSGKKDKTLSKVQDKSRRGSKSRSNQNHIPETERLGQVQIKDDQKNLPTSDSVQTREGNIIGRSATDDVNSTSRKCTSTEQSKRKLEGHVSGNSTHNAELTPKADNQRPKANAPVGLHYEKEVDSGKHSESKPETDTLEECTVGNNTVENQPNKIKIKRVVSDSSQNQNVKVQPNQDRKTKESDAKAMKREKEARISTCTKQTSGNLQMENPKLSHMKGMKVLKVSLQPLKSEWFKGLPKTWARFEQQGTCSVRKLLKKKESLKEKRPGLITNDEGSLKSTSSASAIIIPSDSKPAEPNVESDLMKKSQNTTKKANVSQKSHMANEEADKKKSSRKSDFSVIKSSCTKESECSRVERFCSKSDSLELSQPKVTTDHPSSKDTGKVNPESVASKENKVIYDKSKEIKSSLKTKKLESKLKSEKSSGEKKINLTEHKKEETCNKSAGEKASVLAKEKDAEESRISPADKKPHLPSKKKTEDNTPKEFDIGAYVFKQSTLTNSHKLSHPKKKTDHKKERSSQAKDSVRDKKVKDHGSSKKKHHKKESILEENAKKARNKHEENAKTEESGKKEPPESPKPKPSEKEQIFYERMADFNQENLNRSMNEHRASPKGICFPPLRRPSAESRSDSSSEIVSRCEANLEAASSRSDNSSLKEQVTEENPSSQQVTEANPSSQQVTEGNSSCVQVTETDPSSEHVTEGSNSSELLTDGNANSEQLTEANASSEHVTEGNAISEQLTERITSSEQRTERNASSEQLTEGNASSDQVPEGSGSSEQVTKVNAGFEQVPEGKANLEEITEGNPRSQQGIEGNPCSQQVTEGNPRSQQMTEGNPSSVQVTEGNPSSEQMAKGNPSSESDFKRVLDLDKELEEYSKQHVNSIKVPSSLISQDDELEEGELIDDIYASSETSSIIKELPAAYQFANQSEPDVPETSNIEKEENILPAAYRIDLQGSNSNDDGDSSSESSISRKRKWRTVSSQGQPTSYKRKFSLTRPYAPVDAFTPLQKRIEKAMAKVATTEKPADKVEQKIADGTDDTSKGSEDKTDTDSTTTRPEDTPETGKMIKIGAKSYPIKKKVIHSEKEEEISKPAVVEVNPNEKERTISQENTSLIAQATPTEDDGKNIVQAEKEITQPATIEDKEEVQVTEEDPPKTETESELCGRKQLLINYLMQSQTCAPPDEEEDAVSLFAPSEASFLNEEIDMLEQQRDTGRRMISPLASKKQLGTLPKTPPSRIYPPKTKVISDVQGQPQPRREKCTVTNKDRSIKTSTASTDQHPATVASSQQNISLQGVAVASDPVAQNTPPSFNSYVEPPVFPPPAAQHQFLPPPPPHYHMARPPRPHSAVQHSFQPPGQPRLPYHMVRPPRHMDASTYQPLNMPGFSERRERKDPERMLALSTIIIQQALQPRSIGVILPGEKNSCGNSTSAPTGRRPALPPPPSSTMNPDFLSEPLQNSNLPHSTSQPLSSVPPPPPPPLPDQPPPPPPLPQVSGSSPADLPSVAASPFHNPWEPSPPHQSRIIMPPPASVPGSSVKSTPPWVKPGPSPSRQPSTPPSESSAELPSEPPWQTKRRLKKAEPQGNQSGKADWKSDTADKPDSGKRPDQLKAKVQTLIMEKRWEEFGRFQKTILDGQQMTMNAFITCTSKALLNSSTDNFEDFVKSTQENKGKGVKSSRSITGVGVSLLVATEIQKQAEKGYSVLRVLVKSGENFLRLARSKRYPDYELLYRAVDTSIRNGDFQLAIDILNKYQWLVPEVGHQSERSMRERRLRCLQKLITHYRSNVKQDNEMQNILNKILDTLLVTYDEDQDIVSDVMKKEDIEELLNYVMDLALKTKNSKLAMIIAQLPQKHKLDSKLGLHVHLRQQLIHFVHESSMRDERWLDKLGQLAMEASVETEIPNRLYPSQDPIRDIRNTRIRLSPFMLDVDMHALIHGFMVKLLDHVLAARDKVSLDKVQYRLALDLIEDERASRLPISAQGSVQGAHERLRGVLRQYLRPPLQIHDADLERLHIQSKSLKVYLQTLYDKRRSYQHMNDKETLFEMPGKPGMKDAQGADGQSPQNNPILHGAGRPDHDKDNKEHDQDHREAQKQNCDQVKLKHNQDLDRGTKEQSFDRVAPENDHDWRTRDNDRDLGTRKQDLDLRVPKHEHDRGASEHNRNSRPREYDRDRETREHDWNQETREHDRGGSRGTRERDRDHDRGTREHDWDRETREHDQGGSRGTRERDRDHDRGTREHERRQRSSYHPRDRSSSEEDRKSRGHMSYNKDRNQRGPARRHSYQYRNDNSFRQGGINQETAGSLPTQRFPNFPNTAVADLNKSHSFTSKVLPVGQMDPRKSQGVNRSQGQALSWPQLVMQNTLRYGPYREEDDAVLKMPPPAPPSHRGHADRDFRKSGFDVT